ncbi:MAG TPA: diguanylate cyclase [Candidatus Elarobacter sp.]|jgi:diguanylate cyclase (GGDEF)-like protein/PAS domain S-box-containing protein
MDTTAALKRLAKSVDQLGDAVAILSARRGAGFPAHFVHVNPGFAQLFGFTRAELAGQLGQTVWGPQTDRARMGWLRARLGGSEPGRVVVALYAKDGSPLWVEIVANPVLAAGELTYHVVTYRDVTSRKQYEDALASEKRKLQTTLAAIADAVVTTLADGRVDFVNAAAQRLLGIELVDAYGEQAADVIPLLGDDGAPLDLSAQLADDEGARRGTGQLRTKTGTVDVAYVASPIGDERYGTVLVLRDVTQQNRVARRLTFEASHDALTGLQNRRAFSERLEEAVMGARERGEHHAVGFLDLDRFKVVNDRFGHAAGDQLLREIGNVMSRVVRGGDVLARIGGDEFALLLANCRIDDARRVAEKLRAAVGAYRIEHEGESLGIGVSIGLAAVESETAVSQVLADADAACYQAKAAGRNAVAG